jgi:hypothetical protein
MKLLAVVLTFCSTTCLAQSDEAAVKQTISRFFDGMRTADSNLIKATLAPTVVFQTIIQKKDGSTSVETEKIQAFITTITKPHPQVYDERITFDMIKIDAALATVWAPYKFYVGDTFSHCGVDAFQLVKLAGEWKIQYIIDTRRKDACP